MGGVRRRWPVALLVCIAGIFTGRAAGEEVPPLWLSSATGAQEILVFSKIHRGEDGRGYVLVSEAQRIGARETVKAAAGVLVRANYDMIIPINFGFHLGVHIFVNGRGEPLVAVDTTVTPPALAVSRPYREGGKIFLGTTRANRETRSEDYYRHLADSLEILLPEMAVLVRRAKDLPAGSRLRDAFPPVAKPAG